VAQPLGPSVLNLTTMRVPHPLRRARGWFLRSEQRVGLMGRISTARPAETVRVEFPDSPSKQPPLSGSLRSPSVAWRSFGVGRDDRLLFLIVYCNVILYYTISLFAQAIESVLFDNQQSAVNAQPSAKRVHEKWGHLGTPPGQVGTKVGGGGGVPRKGKKQRVNLHAEGCRIDPQIDGFGREKRAIWKKSGDRVIGKPCLARFNKMGIVTRRVDSTCRNPRCSRHVR
jgi:hypothetical protein